METISNKEKAKEIAESNLKWYYELGNSYDECYQSALQAMRWKDEKHEQEKQQWIDKAESVCAEMFLRIESELFNVGVKNTNNRKEIEDALEIGYKYFKNAMKGE